MQRMRPPPHLLGSCVCLPCALVAHANQVETQQTGLPSSTELEAAHSAPASARGRLAAAASSAAAWPPPLAPRSSAACSCCSSPRHASSTAVWSFVSAGSIRRATAGWKGGQQSAVQGSTPGRSMGRCSSGMPCPSSHDAHEESVKAGPKRSRCSHSAGTSSARARPSSAATTPAQVTAAAGLS